MPTPASCSRSAGVEDAAFADHDAAARNLRRQPLGWSSSVVSKVLRLRLLMPISRERQPQRALELALVVHFEQHVHAEGEGGVLEVLRRRDRRPPP